jgi:hypothetical protein
MKITHITAKLHKLKHTLLSKIAAENNNEQQSQIHVHTQKFRQPARENPSVGKPNERFYSASGKYISAAEIHFPAREFTYSTQQSHRNLPRKACPQIRTVLWPYPFQLLENCAKQ